MGLTDDDEHLSGEVLWEGRDLLKMSKKEWFGLRGTDIAMVYQDALSSLNPSMLISAQMKQLTKRGGTRSAEELLELVGLDPKRTLESYPRELSGGQRQRVLIAMALTRDPKLVICDEPTTALDVTVQKQVIKLLNDLQAKLGFAMIFVSHDLALVAEVAHNITVMYAGQVVERGTAREIFYDSKHPYTWALLSSVPKLAKESKQELYALKGTPPDLILPLNCCPFASRCEYCMPICKERNPFETTITDTHKVSCWLQHPNAPKVKSFYDREAK